YNSGHLLASPIACLDEVAQITMFLAVVCTVIMGVSRCAGDFILGITSVLLSLAWRNKHGTLDPPQANVLVQVPKTVATALSRFNLDSQVTIYAVCPTCHFTYKP
ncbi:hypothetical protein K439DRAFT_1240842, partial [Ramaria rubella]